MLYITEQEVKSLVTMNDALDALDDAFGKWSDVSTANLPRRRLPLAVRSLNVMAAAVPGSDIFGYRAYTSAIRFNLLVLLSLKEERPLALIECGWLSRTRTGAASGIATKYLARKDAKVFSIIGTGRISADQVRAVAAVRDLELIKIFSRNEEKRQRFADQIAEELGIAVEVSQSAQSCVTDADVVTTSTNASEPVFLGEWLQPGMHVNGVGANDGKRCEVDDATVLASDIVAVDQIEQAHIEAGVLIKLVEEGKFFWTGVTELGSIVENPNLQRSGDDQITFFHSLGLAFEDVAFGRLIYDKAVTAGIGRDI